VQFFQQFQQSLHNGDFHAYLVLGGAALTVLALIFYFLPVRRVRVPAIVSCSVGTLALGFGIGVAALLALGYQKEPGAAEKKGDSNEAMAANQGGARGGGRGGPRGGGRGGPASAETAVPPNPVRLQLAYLVTKLDLLAHKKLALDLTKDEKERVARELQGLDQPDHPLSEQEAQKRLEGLLDALRNHKQTLEEAGFRWPGPSNPPRATGDANPFQDKNTAEHLKSLQKTL
jgi:hypothetical protein